MFSDEQLRVFEMVRHQSQAANTRLFLVGGLIRDIFLGEDPQDQDIDFIVEGNAIAFGEILQARSGGELKKFPDFYTAKILMPDGFKEIEEIDLASSRREVYANPGSLPKVELAPIKEDLKRRDFTINAMAVPLDDLLNWVEVGGGRLDALHAYALDFFGGYRDIEDRIIRILHDRSFLEDPTRLFRAARYCARIGGTLAADTERLFREAVNEGALATVSNRRKLNEIRHILSEKNVAACFETLLSLGVISKFPIYRSEHHKEVIELLEKLKSFSELAPEMVFQSALRVFYAHSGEGEFESLGFGSNEIKKLRYETSDSLDLSSQQVMQRVSKPGLIFQVLLGRADSMEGLF